MIDKRNKRISEGKLIPQKIKNGDADLLSGAGDKDDSSKMNHLLNVELDGIKDSKDLKMQKEYSSLTNFFDNHQNS